MSRFLNNRAVLANSYLAIFCKVPYDEKCSDYPWFMVDLIFILSPLWCPLVTFLKIFGSPLQHSVSTFSLIPRWLAGFAHVNTVVVTKHCLLADFPPSEYDCPRTQMCNRSHLHFKVFILEINRLYHFQIYSIETFVIRGGVITRRECAGSLQKMWQRTTCSHGILLNAQGMSTNVQARSAQYSYHLFQCRRVVASCEQEGFFFNRLYTSGYFALELDTRIVHISDGDE